MILCRCECDQVFQVDEALAGTEAECPSCHRVFTVPAESDPDALRMLAAKTAAAAPAESAAPPAEESQSGSALPPVLDGSESRLRLRKGAAAGTDSGSAEEQEGLMGVNQRFPRPPPALKKKSGPLKGIVRAAVVLVVLAGGYKFGFGPILMSLLDRPSLVVVKNGEPVNYEAILGWRRVSQELAGGGIVALRAYVGMTENQTLTLRPTAPGAGDVQKIKVKVRWGRNVLVNVGQKSVFWLIDENGAKRKRVDNELRPLVQQIGANERPTDAEPLVIAVRRVIREAIKGQNTDLFIDLDAYRMDELTGLVPAAPVTADKLLLTAMPVRRLAFANGSVNVTLAQTENLEGQVELPAFPVALLPDVTLNVPARQSLQILRTAKILRFSMHIPNQVLKVRTGQFPGAWDYLATCKADATPADAWHWQWTFNGEGSFEGEKVRVNAVWKMKQMPTVQILKVGAK